MAMYGQSVLHSTQFSSAARSTCTKSHTVKKGAKRGSKNKVRLNEAVSGESEEGVREKRICNGLEVATGKKIEGEKQGTKNPGQAKISLSSNPPLPSLVLLTRSQPRRRRGRGRGRSADFSPFLLPPERKRGREKRTTRKVFRERGGGGRSRSTLLLCLFFRRRGQKKKNYELWGSPSPRLRKKGVLPGREEEAVCFRALLF